MSKRQEQSTLKCSLCLSKNQGTGKTDACSHLFCFPCLKKWAKSEDHCPQCHQKFNKIVRVKCQKGQKARAPVTPAPQARDSEDSVEQGQVEENIFSIINGPQTRNNHVKFLQLYSIFDGLLQE